jgi:NAD(P)H dehydrogenase (quinone)
MTPANSTLFLAVGAGGSHGATGNHVARQLLARGLPVRALVRRADERATELSELGADIAVGASPKSVEMFVRQTQTTLGAQR